LSSSVLGWEGIGRGDGRLTRRRVALDVGGRRVRAGRRHEIHLPDVDGSMSLADPRPGRAPSADTRSADIRWAEVG
jgi:hypothetical protein